MFDGEYILQRQREGIAIAKQNGIYKGRKPLERDNFAEVIGEPRRSGKITAMEAQKPLNMKSSTFYRKVKQNGGIHENN